VSGISPRPLRAGETPAAGDLFFERSYHFAGLVIRFFTGSDINHCGVIVGVDGTGAWAVAEANPRGGFAITRKENADAYVVRVSDDGADRVQLALRSIALATGKHRYDYLAIVRFALIVLGNVRPGTLVGKVVLGLPCLLLRLFARFLLRVLPSDPADRVICSGVTRRLLRDVFDEDGWASSLPVRDDETSPAALFRSLYGRRRW
jgi:hypothetical protein